MFPSKVDYKVDYQALLHAIESHNNRLLFRFYQATRRLSGSREMPTADRDIDWLTVLRGEVSQLLDGVRLMDLHPHEVLHQDVSYVRLHQIKRFGGTTVTAIRQGRGKGSWTSVGSVAARERLPADTRFRSWDSPEHRWIHGQLNLILTRVSRIRVGVDGDPGRGSLDDAEVKAGVLRELDQLEATVRFALRSEPIRAARSDPGAIVTPSTVLLNKSGYSEIYRSIIALRDILTLVGVTREASLANIAKLYEQWCLLEVIDIVRSQFPSADPMRELRIVSERLLAPTIDEGASVLVYELEGFRVSVSNNEKIRTPTGDHKPDILVSIDLAGRPPIKLILDAKYRRYESKSGRGYPGPGQDAINAMHRYRDAVAVNHDGVDLRPVTHAVALFPATATECAGYEDADLFRSIAKTGIGALPFLPGNEQLVRDWLRTLLADPVRALDQAGLPTSREAERENIG